MNFNDITNSLMKGEKIFDLPFRVVYYARVSTDSDVQLNSLDNQLNYYENYIKQKNNWTYIGGYIEEGVSGVTVDKRDSFKTMIKDAKNHKFDLIITKEVSRFARDLEDSIHYIRELKEADVGIYFENQNLNTFDPNSELILNIMFNLAQDESRKLSSRVKFGHREAIKKGHVLGSSNIIGYKKDNCKLVIVPEEAKMIKKIYELYATGEYGFYKLSRSLKGLGYLNKKGNLYDKDTLKRIISNPKYKGYYRARVNEIIDYRTKKRKTNKIEDQIIYKCENGSVPAIVSEELWDRANQILFSRTKDYQNINCYSGGLKYPLSSKLFCKNHNVNFQRSHGSRRKDRPTWACGMYLQHRLAACASPIIAEVDLHNIFKSIMNIIIPNKNNIISEMLALYSNIDKTNQYDKDIAAIDRNINEIKEKKSLAFDMVFSGKMTKDTLKDQFEDFDIKISRLLSEKECILKQIGILNQNKDSIEKISESIKEEINCGALDEFIRIFVDEIIVSKIEDDRHNIKLDIYLNLFSEKKAKQKGAKHINGPLTSDVLYLKSRKHVTTQNIRRCNTPNKFTYDVYVESL
ncbi:MAG: recombinase family protein [Bacilli bacterium]|nr:recombinase family protein [Bacilli bacterium]